MYHPSFPVDSWPSPQLTAAFVEKAAHSVLAVFNASRSLIQATIEYCISSSGSDHRDTQYNDREILARRAQASSTPDWAAQVYALLHFVKSPVKIFDKWWNAPPSPINLSLLFCIDLFCSTLPYHPINEAESLMVIFVQLINDKCWYVVPHLSCGRRAEGPRSELNARTGGVSTPQII